jgi:hypothetical protein
MCRQVAFSGYSIPFSARGVEIVGLNKFVKKMERCGVLVSD